MYIDLTKERIFPLIVVSLMLVVAIGSFVLFDAAQGITARSAARLSRAWSNSTYWLFYHVPGDLSAYATAATSTAPARSVPVLIYHGEGSLEGNMPLATFISQMRALKREGWQTITLKQFEDFMKGRTSVPDKSFLLTFDDGRRDTYYPVDPVLRDMGYTAVMFVITGFSMPDNGKPSVAYLNRSELQYMVQSGRWELQSHGKEDHRIYHVQSTTDLTQHADTVEGHFLSDLMWNNDADRFETPEEFADRLRNDLELSRSTLEQNFGKPVTTFAFPFNDFGQETVNFPSARDIVARVVPRVYTFAFYQTWPANGDSFNYPDPNAVMIRRIEPKNDWTADRLLEALSSGRAKGLPYASGRFGKDWVGIWGNTEVGDTLDLSAAPDTSGASAFLNGTEWWGDYTYQASVDWQRGNTVALLARTREDARYLSCAFSENGVTIEQHDHSHSMSLGRSLMPLSHGALTIAMEVHGMTVSCSINGITVAHAISSASLHGGVGIEVWDEKQGVAHSVFKHIEVQPI